MNFGSKIMSKGNGYYNITMTCKLANICDLIAAAPSGVNQSNNYTQSKAESGSQGSAGEGAASSYKELEPAAATAEKKP